MDIRELTYFVTVAEELSFSRAAGRLHITQPPLSRKIAALEGEIGVRLFDRSPQGVTLTPAGHGLLHEARRILALAGSAPDIARRAARGETGALRIGFVGSTLYTRLPALVGKFRHAYPEVLVTLSQATVVRQVDLLLAGEIDLGFISQPITEPLLETATLFKEPFVVALPAQHRFASRKEVPLAQLASEAFVAFSRQEAPGIHGHLIRMCAAAGFVPRIEVEAYPMSTVVGLVGCGSGLAIVPGSMQRLNIHNVEYRKLTGTKAVSEFLLAWRPDLETPALHNFLAISGIRKGTAGTKGRK
jgi:DNA-binding transcriptional LysR family regulator